MVCEYVTDRTNNEINKKSELMIMIRATVSV